MSTSHNDTEQRNNARLSFESIDAGIKTLDIELLSEGAAAVQTGDRIQRVVTIYQSVRPILTIVGTLPLIPPKWRAALQLFLTALDDVSNSFKAGKDL